MDLMQGSLVTGRCFRRLNVVDDLSRAALAIIVARSISCASALRVLKHLLAKHGEPYVIVMDNASDLTSRAPDA
jgi:putative transposase